MTTTFKGTTRHLKEQLEIEQFWSGKMRNRAKQIQINHRQQWKTNGTIQTEGKYFSPKKLISADSRL